MVNHRFAMMHNYLLTSAVMVCLYVMFCFVIFHGNFPIVEHIHPPGLMQRTQEEVAMNSPLDRLLEVEIIFRPVCLQSDVSVLEFCAVMQFLRADFQIKYYLCDTK